MCWISAFSKENKNTENYSIHIETDCEIGSKYL